MNFIMIGLLLREALDRLCVRSNFEHVSCLHCVSKNASTLKRYNSKLYGSMLMTFDNKMPCYRKDDRAMRPIAYMGGLKIFGSPWIAMPI